MAEILFNQVVTELKKLDKGMLLDIWLSPKDKEYNIKFDDIRLCKFGYYPVNRFEVEYNKALRRYTAYIELEERGEL